jgi:hypothetical protein
MKRMRAHATIDRGDTVEDERVVTTLSKRATPEQWSREALIGLAHRF